MSTKLAHGSAPRQAAAPLWGISGANGSRKRAVALALRLERFLLSSGFLPFRLIRSAPGAELRQRRTGRNHCKHAPHDS